MMRCIASDMDGTLLNSKQKISPANRDAIKLAIEEGIKFVIVTGRSYIEAKEVLDEVGINCPVIGLNGAEVRNEAGEVVYTNLLNPETALNVSKFLNELNIYHEFFTNKGLLTEDYQASIEILVDIFKTANPEISEEEIRNHVKNRGITRNIRNFSDVGDVFKDPTIKFYKILAFDKNDALYKEIGSKLERAMDHIKVTSSGFSNIEINHISAQKGIALERFLDEQGISLQDTMAIGDNFNDVSMLTKVGYSFAMGNAEEDVKQICKFETTRNDEDGVAKAIHTFLEMSKMKRV